MSTLGKAVISFAADTATFIGDVGKAVASFERGIGQMQSAIRGLDGPLARLTAGLSLAGVAIFTKNVIDQAEEIGKLAQKFGDTTENVSALKLAYDLSGGAQDAFGIGLRDFDKSLVAAANSSSKASKVFTALGVDVRAGPAEALRQFVQQMSLLPDGELKTAAAMEILKKAGAEWIPVINGGAKGLDDAAEKARNLGLVISDDFAKSAKRFNENMNLIQKSSMGFANAILAGGVLDTLDQMASRIEKAAEKGEKLRGILDLLKRIDNSAGLSLSPNDPLFQQRESQYQAEDLLGSRGPKSLGQVSVGKIRRPAGDTGSLTASKFGPDQAALATALAEDAAEVKRYVSALKGLENELATLDNLDAEHKTLMEVFGKNITLADGSVVHLEGSLEKLTGAHKINLLNTALAVDERKRLIAGINEEIAAMLKAEAVMRQASESLKDFTQLGEAGNRELAFQTSLLTLSAREQEKANALHQIDLELRRREAELAKQTGDDETLFWSERAKLEAQAEVQRKNAIKGIEERQKVERDWATGSKQAFNEYLDHATNAAEQAHTLFTDAFKGMEDALVNFVKTGKLDFKSLIDSILTDLARISIQRNITGPLAQALGLAGGSNGGLGGILTPGGGIGGGFGGLGSLFNGGGATDMFSAAAGEDLTASFLSDLPALALLGDGGIMTPRGLARLPHYAGGGISPMRGGGQLAVLSEAGMNEAVVPLPNGRSIPVDLGGASANGDTYNIYAPGADAGALARLEQTIRELNGSIEYRAVAAVADARSRGGTFRHVMRR